MKCDTDIRLSLLSDRASSSQPSSSPVKLEKFEISSSRLCHLRGLINSFSLFPLCSPFASLPIQTAAAQHVQFVHFSPVAGCITQYSPRTRRLAGWLAIHPVFLHNATRAPKNKANELLLPTFLLPTLTISHLRTTRSVAASL